MFIENKRYEFGPVEFSEKEIIAFAKEYDPLDFHTDVEKAKTSFFKGLIASGPHIFNYIYKNYWLPLFKDTVICGKEINNWKFLKPIYPNSKVYTIVTILQVTPNHGKQHIEVKWLFEFKNDTGELFQQLEMIILHKLTLTSIKN